MNEKEMREQKLQEYLVVEKKLQEILGNKRGTYGLLKEDRDIFLKALGYHSPVVSLFYNPYEFDIKKTLRYQVKKVNCFGRGDGTYYPCIGEFLQGVAYEIDKSFFSVFKDIIKGASSEMELCTLANGMGEYKTICPRDNGSSACAFRWKPWVGSFTKEEERQKFLAIPSKIDMGIGKLEYCFGNMILEGSISFHLSDATAGWVGEPIKKEIQE